MQGAFSPKRLKRACSRWTTSGSAVPCVPTALYFYSSVIVWQASTLFLALFYELVRAGERKVHGLSAREQKQSGEVHRSSESLLAMSNGQVTLVPSLPCPALVSRLLPPVGILVPIQANPLTQPCRNLMAKQSLEELGLAGVYQPGNVEASSDTTRPEQGFVAGMRTNTGVQKPPK